MGRIWDEFKTALGDQARGSMKHGASTSFRHNRQAMLAARAEREARAGRSYPAPTRDDGYYSQMRPSDPEVVERFVGKDGRITAERPHVHIIHNPKEGRIICTATNSDGSHGESAYLAIDASGNQVNNTVERLRRTLY